jgi:mRNA interferase RelE/StbE
MITVPTDNFQKDLEKIKDVSILKRAKQTVEKMRAANSLREITNIKAIQDFPTFYRIRFGDFRIGFQLTDENTIKLFTIDHRSKIYRHFPKNYIG